MGITKFFYLENGDSRFLSTRLHGVFTVVGTPNRIRMWRYFKCAVTDMYFHLAKEIAGKGTDTDEILRMN